MKNIALSIAILIAVIISGAKFLAHSIADKQEVIALSKTLTKSPGHTLIGKIFSRTGERTAKMKKHADVSEENEKIAHYDSIGRIPFSELEAVSEHSQQKLKKKQYSVEFKTANSAEEASKFMKRLEKSGLKPYYTPFRSGSKILFKVRSGHFNAENEAKALASRIRKTQGINSKVVSL